MDEYTHRAVYRVQEKQWMMSLLKGTDQVIIHSLAAAGVGLLKGVVLVKMEGRRIGA